MGVAELRSTRKRATALAGLALLALPLAAQPLVQNDFEDGTTQGWIPRGSGVSVSNSTAAANGGTHSLLTTGRTAGFMGPSLNILSTLTPGATYQVTVFVRLETGTAPTTVKVTVQRTQSNGSNAFDTVASSSANAVTDAAWVKLTGLYSFTAGSTGLLLYVESSSTTASYYIDDFNITFLAPPPGPPPNTTGLTTTFETGTAEGWKPRIGPEVLTVTSADHHGGTFSLLTSGRTAPFQGPSYDVTNIMFNGSRYQVMLWAKLAPGEAASNLRVSLQRTVGSFTTFHTVIPNTPVTDGQWVRLVALYDVALANNSLSLYVESASGTPSFYIDDVQITYVPPLQIQTNIPSVYQTLADYFPVGAAAYNGGTTGAHADLLIKHFNSITAENAMKWDATEPSEGNFTFSNADALVSLAKANNMKIRGHTFVWHNQTPAWVFLDTSGNPMTPTPENKALLLQRLRNHIQAVGSHFGSDVYAWDVVNEAVDPSQPDCMRRSPWFNITGKDYIDVAFQTARQVLPNAKLFYNDYSTTDAVKRACIYNLVSDLKSRGIPIDGLGHQMHINLDYPGAQAVADTLQLFEGLGMDQQITEMDISVGSGYTFYGDIPPDVLARQGYEYRDYFNVFRQYRATITGVTLWGMADDHTWLTTGTKVDAPLLFDQQVQAKPAYWGVVDPTKLPGAGLTGSITDQEGKPKERVWTLTVRNPGPGTAYATTLTGFTLTQTDGPSCSPDLISPAFPIALGDLAEGASVHVPITLDFRGCAAIARFTMTVPFLAADGADAGSIVETGMGK